MKTVIIARGQDFEKQVEKCTKYARKIGGEVEVVTDSIYNIFQPILNGEIDVILTTDMSRITRKEREYYKIKEVLNNNAVDLIIAPKPETLSYEDTIEVMRRYGRETYKRLLDLDMLFSGQYTKDILKGLEENPYGDELLDPKAKGDYINGRV